jgi:hypothetical protein
MTDAEREEWRPIPGLDGYDVSDHGRPRSWRKVGRNGGRLETPRILALSRVGRYFAFVVTRRDGKYGKFYIHQAVLTAFVGPCPAGMQCRHFPDRDPANNRLENLAWGTVKANHADKRFHGTQRCGEAIHLAKLTENEVREMIRLHAVGSTWTYLGAKFGVHRSTVRLAVLGATWRHLHTAS